MIRMKTLKSIWNSCKTKKDLLVPGFTLLLCIWTMIVLVHYSGYSFWGDEIGTIAIANPTHTLYETLMIDLTEDTTVAPLFYLVANLWMRVVPYGTSRLLLICEIFVCIGIFITAMTAKNLSGNICGIAAAVLSAAMPYLAIQGAYEFRSYAVCYLFTTLTLYFYFRKLKDPRLSNIIFYGISAIFMSFSLYSAVLLYFAMFLADLFLYLKKRISIKNIISYLLWGTLFFPVLVYAFLHVSSRGTSFWTSAPAFSQIFTVIPEILIDPLLIILWYAGVVWMLYRCIRLLQNKNENDFSKNYPALFLYWLTLACRIVNFIYSNLNSRNSMWTPRYFFFLLPCIVLFITLAFYDILTQVFRRTNAGSVKVIVPVTAVICACYLEFSFIQACKRERYPEIIRQPFEQGAEFLRTMDDLRAPDTAVYYSAYNIEAWQYYLAHGDMTPGLFNLLPMDVSGIDLSPYKTIYMMIIEHPMLETTREIFEREYLSEEIHHNYRIYRLTRK